MTQRCSRGQSGAISCRAELAAPVARRGRPAENPEMQDPPSHPARGGGQAHFLLLVRYCTGWPAAGYGNYGPCWGDGEAKMARGAAAGRGACGVLANVPLGRRALPCQPFAPSRRSEWVSSSSSSSQGAWSPFSLEEFHRELTATDSAAAAAGVGVGFRGTAAAIGSTASARAASARAAAAAAAAGAAGAAATAAAGAAAGAASAGAAAGGGCRVA